MGLRAQRRREAISDLHRGWRRGRGAAVDCCGELERERIGNKRRSPPKLGGVPSAARRGGSAAEVLQDAALEPPRLLARLAGTPPDSGGEFPSLPIYSRLL